MLTVPKPKLKVMPTFTEPDEVTELHTQRTDSVIRRLASMANDDQSVIYIQEHLDQRMRTQPEYEDF